MNHIRWLAVLLCVWLSVNPLHATKNTKIDSLYAALYPSQAGAFSLGLRNTLSFFNHGNPKEIGTGIGAHFRILVVDRVNTEWFADFLPANVFNRAHRLDYHIGWSVMFYLIRTHAFQRKFTPYVLAGNCFDYTFIRMNGADAPPGRKRFSSAVQAGIGCHYNITPRFDLSLTTQYMIHLGKELHAEQQEDGSVVIEEHKHAGWEGHLLISLSLNYKIAQLWNPKRK